MRDAARRTIHPLAGKPAPESFLVDVDRLRQEYYSLMPDVADRRQRVSFGTSGHRGSSLRGAFNEAHVLAITQAICTYRRGLGISGPLFIGKDTHALSDEAFATALEVLAANGVETMIDGDEGYTPTPAVSHAILRHNRNRTSGLADGIVITPSHNPPEDGGFKNVVVSRRKHLEEQQRAAAVDMRKSIVPGAILTGRVASVLEFGAFVELGSGIQGLLHVSEMSWSRVNPNEIVASGDQITVKVLRVDDATQKISLGLKQLLDDPWTTVAANYAVGQVRTGRVTRLADFGAFVELEPGIEGLAHASTFPPTGRTRGWAESVAVGSSAAFEILSIDPVQKRIGIALVDEGSSRIEGATMPDAEPTASLGTLADSLRNALKGR